MSATQWWSRWARLRASSRRSMNSTRLGSPVSWSCTAACARRSRISRRSVTSSICPMRYSGPPGVVAHAAGADRDPHHVAVGVDVALLHVVAVDVPGHQGVELHGVGLPVVGVGDVFDGPAHELVGVVPEDVAVGAVDPHQAPVGRRQAHADGGVLEGAAKARLGLEDGGLRRRNRPPTHATISPTSTQHGTTNSAELSPWPAASGRARTGAARRRRPGAERSGPGPAGVAEPQPHEHDEEEGAVEEGVVAGEAVVEHDHAQGHGHEPQGGRSPPPCPRHPEHHRTDGDAGHPDAHHPRSRGRRRGSSRTAPARATSSPVPDPQGGRQASHQVGREGPLPDLVAPAPVHTSSSAPGAPRQRRRACELGLRCAATPSQPRAASTSAAARWPEDTAPSM